MGLIFSRRSSETRSSCVEAIILSFWWVLLGFFIPCLILVFFFLIMESMVMKHYYFRFIWMMIWKIPPTHPECSLLFCILNFYFSFFYFIFVAITGAVIRFSRWVRQVDDLPLSVHISVKLLFASNHNTLLLIVLCNSEFYARSWRNLVQTSNCVLPRSFLFFSSNVGEPEHYHQQNCQFQHFYYRFTYINKKWWW